MNINKIVTGLLAALMLAWVPAAYAVDNNTEFGIEDDLTVIGNQGTMMDPDVELRGFTLLGSTGAAQTVYIPQTPGNMYVSGYVQVSSGMYVAGSSTFTSGAYFTGISSFNNVNNIHIGGGTGGQVLVKVAGGGLDWGTVSSMVSGDNLGSHIATMTLQMGNFGIVNVASITANGYITTYSSMSVGTELIVAGTSALNGDVDMNAKLNVDQDATFISSVTALGNVQLGDATGTDKVTVNMPAADPRADAALTVAGIATSGVYAAKFYSGADLAAWIKKK
ncbi:MAG TPA: hypothetical protein DCS63_03370 [Elusimicrobia bacterium]|nr:hypothetical protein [Elusimicrobiota bacterium]